jgi:predicted short-subunit dehydrogenase-like oxidoreductase (DUF2520 family)
MHKHNISFIGAGNVASSLCREMYRKGLTIDLVVSEGEINGKTLALSCKAEWSSHPRIPSSTKIVIVAVPDHKLKSVLAELICDDDTLIVHTAGSLGLDIFPEKILRKGVFYPLQTFTKNRNISFNDIPFLIESPKLKDAGILKSLAESLSSRVYFADTQHRRILHLAAVFVNNFTNHMFVMGQEIALKAGFSFEILSPLIHETISKAIELGPENSQTGPAIRNDKNTIEKHLDLLSFSPELQRLYNDLTKSIVKYYEKK